MSHGAVYFAPGVLTVLTAAPLVMASSSVTILVGCTGWSCVLSAMAGTLSTPCSPAPLDILRKDRVESVELEGEVCTTRGNSSMWTLRHGEQHTPEALR